MCRRRRWVTRCLVLPRKIARIICHYFFGGEEGSGATVEDVNLYLSADSFLPLLFHLRRRRRRLRLLLCSFLVWRAASRGQKRIRSSFVEGSPSWPTTGEGGRRTFGRAWGPGERARGWKPSILCTHSAHLQDASISVEVVTFSYKFMFITFS